MHVVGPRGGTCGHHIYQIYASYLHVRILYEFLGTFQSLKVFGKFKNKSKCFWKPSSKFTIRNGYLVTVYKSGFEACLWSTSCASALVLALEIRRISSPSAQIARRGRCENSHSSTSHMFDALPRWWPREGKPFSHDPHYKRLSNGSDWSILDRPLPSPPP